MWWSEGMWGRRRNGGEGFSGAVVAPEFCLGHEADGSIGIGEGDGVGIDVSGGEFHFSGLGEAKGQIGGVEGELAGAGEGVDDIIFMLAGGGGDAIPELVVVVEPMRLNAEAEDFVAGEIGEMIGALVILERATGEGGAGEEKEDQGDQLQGAKGSMVHGREPCLERAMRFWGGACPKMSEKARDFRAGFSFPWAKGREGKVELKFEISDLR